MKKCFISAIMALTAMAAQAQTAYNISGTASPEIKKVYLFWMNYDYLALVADI